MTVVTHRTISVVPETRLFVVSRGGAAPSGFPSDFVETRLWPEAVYLNDCVTVDCRHEGQRLVALKITLAEAPLAEFSR